MGASLQKEVEFVDRFLSGRKSLYGPPPSFGQSGFCAGNGEDWASHWPIQGEDGVIDVAELRLCIHPGDDFKDQSISLIISGQSVYRIDLVRSDVCHNNPVWAGNLGLPPKVCGSHAHCWEHNREHILRTGAWVLPAREAIGQQVRRFEQAVPWFCDKIRIDLNYDQRDIHIPDHLTF